MNSFVRRRKTREVRVGTVGVGGDNPIRIQSMTTSPTSDIKATVAQIVRLSDAGCEIARVTVQGKREALACEGIKNRLIQLGYTIPLVADIHFYPPAALLVAEFVDKVRINPGNFADRRATFKVLEYSDQTYAEELEKIAEKFIPLVDKCKRLKRALRIGVNHGSLSDRIMNRFGDTPLGMVESALEYAHICRAHDYHNFLFSMKSSNPKVMIATYRLLVERMDELGWDYPLHLGVTEAGEGEDGRIKSAMGTGALLLDGIGDTIRVSLTEDPWHEIDPCKRLIAFASEYKGDVIVPIREKRQVTLPSNLHRSGTVILRRTEVTMPKADIVVECDDPFDLNQQGTQACVVDSSDEADWETLKCQSPSMVFLRPRERRIETARRFFAWLKKWDLKWPVILNFTYECSYEDLIIRASSEMGSLLCDGLGEGIFIEGPYAPATLSDLSFNILQAARMRMVKTDFISCPSCGRTLFDLQMVTKRIRERTAHLPGVKIAIMGCIVNGPGEMADADFGYVGSKPGKIDLYVGRECVERNIDFDDADDRLVELIKAHGLWQEPLVNTCT